jgi:hypothetical protein
MNHIDWSAVLQDQQNQVEAVEYLMNGLVQTAPLRNRTNRSNRSNRTNRNNSRITKTDLEKGWMVAAQDYIFHTLSPGQRVTLYAYSSQEYGVINDFLRGGTKYLENVLDIPDPTEAPMVALDVLEALPGPQGDVVRQDWVQRFDAAKEAEDLHKAVVAEFQAWLVQQWPQAFLDAFALQIMENTWTWTCVYVHQSRVLTQASVPDAPQEILALPHGLARFRQLLPYLTQQSWRLLVETLVADMDVIFAGAPPLPTSRTVFRGADRAMDPRTYTSTSLKLSVAQDYANKETGCCVYVYTVPAGQRVLPIWTLSRYPVEHEVLLPRHATLARVHRYATRRARTRARTRATRG